MFAVLNLKAPSSLSKQPLLTIYSSIFGSSKWLLNCLFWFCSLLLFYPLWPEYTTCICEPGTGVTEPIEDVSSGGQTTHSPRDWRSNYSPLLVLEVKLLTSFGTGGQTILLSWDWRSNYLPLLGLEVKLLNFLGRQGQTTHHHGRWGQTILPPWEQKVKYLPLWVQKIKLLTSTATRSQLTSLATWGQTTDLTGY